MKGYDDAIELAKQVMAMAEVIALKPVGERNIRLVQKSVQLLARNSDSPKVAELREFLRLHEIRIHEVADGNVKPGRGPEAP